MTLSDVLTPAEEKRIARELTPPVAWPTLAMALALPAAFWALLGLGFAHLLSPWACCPLLVFLSYAHYTLVHESIHNNLVPGHPKLRWLNTLVGWMGALALGGSWPALMRTHVLHHAHTNADDDPDIYVKGTFRALLIKWLIYVPVSLVPVTLGKYLSPALFRRSSDALSAFEAAQASLVTIVTLASLGWCAWHGRSLDWLLLFFVPTRVAALILAVCFQWLPHYPFDRTERYLNTRISLWPAGTFLTLQQNLHLMHHLWPGVPFYNYARLYTRLRPTLIGKGSRIEGLMPLGQMRTDERG